MIKFGSIEQFRNIMHDVRHRAKWLANAVDADGNDIPDVQYTLPTIQFTGTVKLHGSNASINYDVKNMTFTPQSRNRELSLESDNAGFALWASTNTYFFDELVTEILEKNYGDFENIVVYGEWAGPGIQSGVAISNIPKKSFFIFSIVGVNYEMRGDSWHTVKTHIPLLEIDTIEDIEDETIFNILTFPTWTLDIDFENPEEAQNTMISITNEVERECPVGRYFGVSGVGEGVVWTAQLGPETLLSFKVKGEKHSVSKVKTLASVDIEKVNTVKEFVSNVLTDARLNQGIEYLKEMNYEVTQKSTGHFLKWIASDIFKEEADTIVENGLDNKMIGGQISQQARKWFFEKGIEK